MTVAELIAELQKCPPASPVAVQITIGDRVFVLPTQSADYSLEIDWNTNDTLTLIRCVRAVMGGDDDGR